MAASTKPAVPPPAVTSALAEPSEDPAIPAAAESPEVPVQYEPQAGDLQADEGFRKFYLPQLDTSNQSQEHQNKDQDDQDDQDAEPLYHPLTGMQKRAPKKGPSKRDAKKELKGTRLAVLKRVASDAAEVSEHDANAEDPLFLLLAKRLPGTVGVPGHWVQKKGFLRRQRAGEVPAYQLPPYVQATGVAEMREALRARDGDKTARQLARERVRPKMARLELDYQSLHDAFFLHQTKPPLTPHGLLFREGAFLSSQFPSPSSSSSTSSATLPFVAPAFIPGVLSPALRQALGMSTSSSASSPQAPPPYLFAMQRYGPPPAYPSLDIPGLNAPLPEGCRYGYQPGEWGRPPTDPAGNPVFPRSVLTSAAAASAAPSLIQPLAPAPSYRFGRITGPTVGQEDDDDDDDSSDRDGSDDDDDDDDENGVVGNEIDGKGKAEKTVDDARAPLLSDPDRFLASISQEPPPAPVSASTSDPRPFGQVLEMRQNPTVDPGAFLDSAAVYSIPNKPSSSSSSSSPSTTSSSTTSASAANSSSSKPRIVNPAKRSLPPKRDDKAPEPPKKKQKEYKF
ncbi:MAG: DUF382 domain-containing protein [archaeon]|nr:DUF382 domain-containing protein [archaeon]